MNIKKIILFTVILMIAVSSLSMVSAGWFDFGSSNTDEIDAKIINASISVNKTWVKSSNSVGVNEAMNIVGSSDPDIEEGYKFSENMTLDISSANDDVKNKLFDIFSGKNSGNKKVFVIEAQNNVTTDNDYFNNNEFFGTARALDNNTITIWDVHYDTVKNASGVNVGNVPIKSGKAIIFDLDSPDKNVTINF